MPRCCSPPCTRRSVRLGVSLPHDYSTCLDARALEGVRLAYDRRYADGDLAPRDDDLLAVVDRALEEMRAAGAVIDEITTADPTAPGGGRPRAVRRRASR